MLQSSGKQARSNKLCSFQTFVVNKILSSKAFVEVKQVLKIL
jgi:hypothetical protein